MGGLISRGMIRDDDKDDRAPIGILHTGLGI
jgi:hypothetical protein